MHKNGKWAKQIIDWQNADGSWGDYHSLAVTLSINAKSTYDRNCIFLSTSWLLNFPFCNGIIKSAKEDML